MNYANHIGWSDVNPYEVIRKVSDKCYEVRAMQTEKSPNYQPEFVAGGFSAVCLNQGQQKWIITSDEQAPILRIRASKKKGWADKYGKRFELANEPCKYYDYNF